MKLHDNQLDQPFLSTLGEEACRLFIVRDFRGLADTFGYALAYNRDIATAIEADFNHCTQHSQAGGTVESVTVRNFKPNDTGLLSVVECVLLFDRGARVLAELIVAKNGEKKNLYLEDISVVA